MLSLFILNISLEHLQEFPKLTPNLDFFSKIEKNCSPTPPYLNSQSFDPIAQQYARAYQTANLKVEGREEE